MPKRAPTPCRDPGCPELVYEKAAQGYCAAHQCRVQERKARYERTSKQRRRQDATQARLDVFYNGANWKRVRDAHKALEPLCRHCAAQGIIKAGDMVDHIQERRDGGADYDHNNLQTLCNSCHAIKTQAERMRRRQQ
jgi:5-methylcytosine-specific restriction protein A